MSCWPEHANVGWSMWSRTALVKLFVEHERRLLQLLLNFEPQADAPEPEPEPEPAPKPKSKHPPGSMEWYLALPPGRKGGGLSMNEMARGAPKLRPPRRPGMQSRRYNGLWWHY